MMALQEPETVHKIAHPDAGERYNQTKPARAIAAVAAVAATIAAALPVAAVA